MTPDLQQRAAEAVAELEYSATDALNDDYRGTLRREAMLRAADLITELAGQVPRDGWKLVPVEPTEEMKRAGRTSLRDGGLLPAYTDEGRNGQTPIMQHLLGPAYRAMPAAAPPPPPEEKK